jgi:hypothetical protein
LGEVDFKGSFEFFFALFRGLSLFVPFVGLAVFLLLDDILELFLTFLIF